VKHTKLEEIDKFVTLRVIKEYYSISYPFVMDLVRNKKVRTIKTGPSKSAQRLFNLKDIHVEFKKLELAQNKND